MKAKSRSNRRLNVEELEGRLVLSPIVTTSTNWSGYAISTPAGAVTAVSGSWTVPTVTGTSTGYAASWVGIDGFSSPTVEQIGTEADIINGQPTYYAWYEMYPNYSVNLTNLTIKPGDLITASVSYLSGKYTLTIADGSQKDTITQSGSSFQRSSAEWVVEAPSSNSGVLPLANFGTDTFSNAQATIDNVAGPITDSFGKNVQAYEINMVSNTRAAEDTTSALNAAGTGFTVTYDAPATTPPTPTRPTPPPPSGHHGHGGSGGSWWQTELPAVQAASPPGNASGANLINGSAGLAAILFSATNPLSPQFQANAAQSLTVNGAVIANSAVPQGSVSQPGINQARPADSATEPDHVPGEQRPMPEAAPKDNDPMDQMTPGSGASSLLPVLDSAASATGTAEAARLSGQTSAAGFMEARWVPGAPEDDARALLPQGENNGHTTDYAAAAMLIFALGGTRGPATEEAARRRKLQDLL